MDPVDHDEIDHDYTKSLVCPHCGYVQRDSSDITGDDEDGETECQNCEKRYRWSRYIEITYCTERRE